MTTPAFAQSVLQTFPLKSVAVPTQLGKWVVHTMGDHGPWVICWPTIMADHRCYLDFATAISPHFRVLLVDPPGYFANRDMARSERASGLMLMLMVALKQLKIDQFHWVGVGFGAHLGAALQRKCADRFLSTTLSSMPLIQAARVSMIAQLLQNLVAHSQWGRRWFASNVSSQMTHATPTEAAAVTDYLLDVVSQCNLHAVKHMRPTPQDKLNALRVILKSSQVPTLVIAGKFDSFCKPRDQQTAAQLVRRSKFVTVNSGFMTFMTLPQECAAIFVEFVDKFGEKARNPDGSLDANAEKREHTAMRSALRTLDQSSQSKPNSSFL